MKINIDSENLALRPNANVCHESAEDWYGSYGAHVSTEECGDITVQEVDYKWLDPDKSVDDWRDEALAEITPVSEGDFHHCDDKPNDLKDACKRGDEEDMQAWVDYLRRDDYPDEGLEAVGNELADEIEAALEQVREINSWADRADNYAACKVKGEHVSMTWGEIESLVDLASRVRAAAESVVAELDEAATSYSDGDLEGVLEHLRAARSIETDHGDDPATSELASQLLIEFDESALDHEVHFGDLS